MNLRNPWEYDPQDSIKPVLPAQSWVISFSWVTGTFWRYSTEHPEELL